MNKTYAIIKDKLGEITDLCEVRDFTDQVEFEQLKNRVAIVKNSAETKLNEEKANLENQIAEIKNKVLSLEGIIAELQNKVASVKGKVKGIGFNRDELNNLLKYFKEI